MCLRKVIVFVGMMTLNTVGQAVDVPQAGGHTENLQPASTACALVPNAQIKLTDKKPPQRDTPPWKWALAAANYGQEIVGGNGYVLSFRQFEGSDGPVDAARFLKVTLALQLSDLKLAEGQEIQVPVVDGYYIQGAVGFVHKREYWQARRPVTNVVLRRLTTGLTATLEATFTANYVSSGESKPVHLDTSCKVVETVVGHLKSWEGKPGTDWNSFSPEH